MDSWFPHARALFASFGLVTYFDSCRQIEYMAACVMPSLTMVLTMSSRSVAGGLPTLPLLLTQN